MQSPLLEHPDRLERRLKEIPTEPGCYLMRDAEDRLLYVGKSKSLRSRVRSYFRSRHDLSPRIRLMVRQIVKLSPSSPTARPKPLRGNQSDQNQQPHFNVLLKDDKKYPYRCITWREAYPRIFITRRRRFRSPLDRFYGPYVDVGLLRRTLFLVKRVFPLRQRPRPLHQTALAQLQHRALSGGLPGKNQLRGLSPHSAQGGHGVSGPQRRTADPVA